MFKRKATKRPFRKAVIAVHEHWTQAVAVSPRGEDPEGIVLSCAFAGAAVALGSYGTFLRDNFADNDAHLDQSRDYIVEFAHALDDPSAVESAFRVAAWALVAEQATFYWQPNYDIEVSWCAEVFGLDNIYEETVVEYGRPLDTDASVEQKGKRLYELVKASLYCMVGAAIEFPVEPEDIFINMHLDAWHTQMAEALSTTRERCLQLRPDGLPIWED